MKKFLVGIIEFYQMFSRFTARHCRFYPTCSEYTRQAIQIYGIKKGICLGLKRILKCHPFHPGGYDPVENATTNFTNSTNCSNKLRELTL